MCIYRWLLVTQRMWLSMAIYFFFLVQDNVNPVLAMVLQPRMVYGSIGATEMDTRQCDKRLAKRRWVVVKRRSRCDGVSFELQIHICVSGWWYQIFFHVSGGNPLVVVDDAGSLLIYLGILYSCKVFPYITQSNDLLNP